MSKTTYEIIVYEVTDRTQAIEARRNAMEAAMTYPGFLSYRALNGIEPATLLADLIVWEDHAAAKAAGEKVKSDPAFAGIFGIISDVKVVAHFTSDTILSAEV